MAIQFRHGVYGEFDPEKMVTGEPAVVQSGDPVAYGGKATYICYGPGDVQRLCTYDEMTARIDRKVESEVSAAIGGLDEALENSEYVQETIREVIEDHPEWTTSVQNGSISNAKLASYAVSAAKIAASAVSTVKIADGAVTNDKIASNTITGSKIKVNTISNDKIVHGTIKDEKLAPCNVTDTDVRENIAQGETRATIFGKIKKWFTDLAPLLVEESVNMSDADNPYGITVIQLRRKGKLVQIYFGGPCKNFTKAWTTVATIPTAFRPTYQVPYDTQIPQTSGTDQFLVSVLANGAFRIYPMTDNALNGAYINSTFWYFID